MPSLRDDDDSSREGQKVSLFSGTRLTERNVETTIDKQVHLIVRRLVNSEIEPIDARRQLTDLLVRAANAMAGIKAREGVE